MQSKCDKTLTQPKRGKQCTVTVFCWHEVFQNKMEKLEIPSMHPKDEAMHHVHMIQSLTVHVIITQWDPSYHLGMSLPL